MTFMPCLLANQMSLNTIGLIHIKFICDIQTPVTVSKCFAFILIYPLREIKAKFDRSRERSSLHLGYTFSINDILYYINQSITRQWIKLFWYQVRLRHSFTTSKHPSLSADAWLYSSDKHFQLLQNKYFPHGLQIDAFWNNLIGQMDI